MNPIVLPFPRPSPEMLAAAKDIRMSCFELPDRFGRFFDLCERLGLPRNAGIAEAHKRAHKILFDTLAYAEADSKHWQTRAETAETVIKDAAQAIDSGDDFGGMRLVINARDTLK